MSAVVPSAAEEPFVGQQEASIEEVLRLRLLLAEEAVDGRDTTLDENMMRPFIDLDEEEKEIMENARRERERELLRKEEDFLELQRIYTKTSRQSFKFMKRFPEPSFVGERDEEDIGPIVDDLDCSDLAALAPPFTHRQAWPSPSTMSPVLETVGANGSSSSLPRRGQGFVNRLRKNRRRDSRESVDEE